MSVGVFLLYLFPAQDRIRRGIVYFLLFASITLATIVFALGFTCGGNTLSQSRGARCHLVGAYNHSNLAWSVVNMVTDFSFSILCVQLIFLAKLNIRAKLVASSLMLIASAGAACSILRVTACAGVGWSDLTLGRTVIARYSTLEAGICIIAGCLATLRPLMAIFFGFLSHKSTKNSTDPESLVSKKSASEKQFPQATIATEIRVISE